MDVGAETIRLNRQCRRLTVAAVVVLVCAFSISIPTMLERRRHLYAANAELLQIQTAIIDTQSKIKDTQRSILLLQAEIESRLHEKRK